MLKCCFAGWLKILNIQAIRTAFLTSCLYNIQKHLRKDCKIWITINHTATQNPNFKTFAIFSDLNVLKACHKGVTYYICTEGFCRGMRWGRGHVGVTDKIHTERCWWGMKCGRGQMGVADNISNRLWVAGWLKSIGLPFSWSVCNGLYFYLFMHVSELWIFIFNNLRIS